MRVEPVAEDGGAGDWLDDFVDHGGGELGEAHAECEGGRDAAVGLVGSVGGREGVDAEGADAHFIEPGEGSAVVGGHDADFHGRTEEGSWVRG